MNVRIATPLLAFASLLVYGPAVLGAPNTYQVERLPHLDASSPTSFAYGIGPTGLVVGSSSKVDGNSNPPTAVLWDAAGSVIDLTPSLVDGNALAINSAGEVVLNAYTGLLATGYAPYTWSNGTLTAVNLGASGNVQDINDAGQIVGFRSTAAGSRAIVLANGVATELGTLPGTGAAQSYANGLNDVGQIVGSSSVPGTANFHAVQWNNGAIVDLGTLPGDTSSYARAINNAGQAIGASGMTGSYANRAVVWNNGVPTDLGFGSYASAAGINSSGDIVGYANVGPQLYDAYLLRGGVRTRLNDIVGGNWCDAGGINDAGQIVGQCDGQAFRLTPIAPGTDLGVAISASSAQPGVGIPLTYTIAVNSVGSLVATGVVLSDLLPSGTTFVSAVPSQGSCSGTTSVSCALGSIASSSSATVQLTVTPTVTGKLTNSVSVAANEYDANLGNNTASVSRTVISTADVSVAVTATPNPVRVKTNLTYKITVRNAGPGSAGVNARDTLPPSMSLVSIGSTLGSCSFPSYLDKAVNCSFGTMASGASAVVTMVVRPQSTGTFSNTVSVTSTAVDNNTANNSATTTTTVKR